MLSLLEEKKPGLEADRSRITTVQATSATFGALLSFDVSVAEETKHSLKNPLQLSDPHEFQSLRNPPSLPTPD